MPIKDPVARREYHRQYMKQKYAQDAVHRQKQLVRVKTRKRVESGAIERPAVCNRCGGSEPEAHHPDYNQPELREWICRDCHRKEHPGLF